MSAHLDGVLPRIAAVTKAVTDQWRDGRPVEAELAYDSFACLQVAAVVQARANNVEATPELVLRMMRAAKDAMDREIAAHKGRN